MSSLFEKAAQIVFPRLGSNMNPPVRDVDDAARFSEALASYPFGGLVLFNGHVEHTPVLLERLQRQSKKTLLVASDIERGAGQQIKGATLFPHAMAAAVAGPSAVSKMGRITAIEALKCGLHITFAPVADVNSDPRNPIIGIRSFGEEPNQVARCVQAYIKACRREGLLTTAKHFPGHGNTATDSHTELPIVDSTREELWTIDLPPFSAAVEQGVDLVMTAHVAFPALDPTSRPATVSPPILTQLLRGEMNFRGPVITDSLIMGAVQQDEGRLAAFAADMLNAGVDILLDPPNPPAMVEAVIRAVEHDMISRSRLHQACERVDILRRRIDANEAARSKGPFLVPETHREEALRIAETAITTRDGQKESSPILTDKTTRCIFIKPYKTHLDPPEEPMGALMRQSIPSIDYTEVFDETEPAILESLLETAGRTDQLLVPVVSKPAAWRNYGLPDKLSVFLTRLIQAAPTTLIALGDPQLLHTYPGATSAVCTYSDVPASQEALVRILISLADKTP